MHIDSHYAASLENKSRFEALDGDLKTETCVIGGGFAGLTTARELARADHEVVLIDSRVIGFGATGRNGGFVSAGFARGVESIAEVVGWEQTRKLYELSISGVDYVRRTIKDLELDDALLGDSWLKILRHPEISELTDLNEFLTKKIGVTQKLIKKDELEDYVKSDLYHAALLDKDAFHIQPLAYAYGLANSIVSSGGRIFENTHCHDIAHGWGKDGKRWVVKTANGLIYCDNIVLCTSAYNGPWKKLNDSMVPIATYVVSSAPAPELLDELIPFKGCISDTRRSGDYYRTIGSGSERRLIWGGRITTMRSQPEKLAEMLKADMTNVYQQMAELEIERAWSGLMGYSSHQMPIIAEPETGLYTASAFGGHGLNTTAMGGLLISDAILGNDNKLQLFSPFGLNWSGGLIGRLAVQLEYWRLQYLDRRDEAKLN